MLVDFRAATGFRKETGVMHRMMSIMKPPPVLLVRQDIKASLLPAVLYQRVMPCSRNVDSKKGFYCCHVTTISLYHCFLTIICHSMVCLDLPEIKCKVLLFTSRSISDQ